MSGAPIPTPKLEFPAHLPVCARVDDIAEAIQNHQVVVLVGDTGSGKTTQLPKICLALGRGQNGLIGHTQPRRLAARSVAQRIAQETETELGDLVGYKVRFQDTLKPGAKVKLLTDGMLLAETRGDKLLKKYDTIIIDEAHERGLNIDFLLGYLKRLLPKRRDLKVIITSATINFERFAGHFNNAPVIQVEGRTFPVDVRYRPVESDDDEVPLYRGIVQAVEEFRDIDKAQGKRQGDVLVFLPGEREIRGAAEALRKSTVSGLDVLPLYARLSNAEQQRIFNPTGGPQRIVLATNVAETSLTVPGIRYVIDSGLARISRYSYRSKVQRLPVEAISQASANQRKGRCGRLEPGICIRLYSEEDFTARREFTEPELQRTNLASVILQMLDLKLGEIERFPFIDPPDRRYVTDGIRLLEDIGALTAARVLTPLGQQLAKLPVDPKLGRIVLAGQTYSALDETLAIASFLSVQDPRERPRAAQEAADLKHAQDQHEQSDFLAIVKLWKRIEAERQTLTSARFRKWCQAEFLHYLRVREWREVHRQLWLAVKGQARLNTEPADYANLHRAVLTGYVGQVGLRDEQDYRGTRDTRFQLHPSRGIEGRPKWVVVAELVETRRLFGRVVAKIEPEWIEDVARHLIKYSHGDPYWSKRQGRIMAHERGSLLGLPVVPKRAVGFVDRAPAKARELLIRDGLAQGEIKTQGAFLQNNLDQVARILDREARERRRDLLDDQRLFEFYDQRLPGEILDQQRFERWRRRIERDHPKYLFMREEDVLRDGSAFDHAAYPSTVEVAGNHFELSYEFNPGSEQDGVTLVVPSVALNSLSQRDLDWLVPGLLTEKVEALLRTLPKAVRRQLVPLPSFAREVCRHLDWGKGDLLEALGRQITRQLGKPFDVSLFDLTLLDPYYRMSVRVVDERGKTLHQSRDLVALKQRFKAEPQVIEAAKEPTRTVTDWSVGDLPERREVKRAGLALQLTPAFQVTPKGVVLADFDDPREAAREHRLGTLQLAREQLPQQAKLLRQSALAKQIDLLAAPRKLNPKASEQWLLASLESACFGEGIPRHQGRFQQALEQGRSRWVSVAEAQAKPVLAVLKEAQGIGKQLKSLPLAWLEIAQDVEQQLSFLLHPGFLLDTPTEWLERLPAYLTAIQKRLDRAGGRFEHDRQARRELHAYWDELTRLWPNAPFSAIRPEVLELRWLLEEYRISLFAQELGTYKKVSSKRINQLLAEAKTKRSEV